MNRRRRRLISFALFSMVLIDCSELPRTNPLDPQNRSSRRDMMPVVLSFVYNNGGGTSVDNYQKAYSAYQQVSAPLQVVSFEVPLDVSTNSAKRFLKDHWEDISGNRILPRVFVGSNLNPLAGIATTGLHLDSIETRAVDLLGRTCLWTLEGEAEVSERQFGITVRVARLGAQKSAAMKVAVFLVEKQTNAWSKGSYVFEPQSITAMSPGSQKTVSFSKELTSQEIPAAKSYVAIIFTNNNVIEQGVLF